MRQGNGVETSPGEVKGVSSSCCFPFSIILTRSIGDREDDGVAYAETGLFFPRTRMVVAAMVKRKGV